MTLLKQKFRSSDAAVPTNHEKKARCSVSSAMPVSVFLPTSVFLVVALENVPYTAPPGPAKFRFRKFEERNVIL